MSAKKRNKSIRKVNKSPVETTSRKIPEYFPLDDEWDIKSKEGSLLAPKENPENPTDPLPQDRGSPGEGVPQSSAGPPTNQPVPGKPHGPPTPHPTGPKHVKGPDD